MTIPPPSIRPATTEDLATIGRIHAEAATLAYAHIFPADSPPPTPEALAGQWRTVLDDPDPRAEILVATIPGEAADPAVSPGAGSVVGALAVAPSPDVPTGLLLQRLYIDPAHQGLGIGATLHDHAIERVRRRGSPAINLWVLEANERARRIYEHRGWRLVPGRTLANEPPTVLDVLYQLSLD